jgi:hypothetical protein
MTFFGRVSEVVRWVQFVPSVTADVAHSVVEFSGVALYQLDIYG